MDASALPPGTRLGEIEILRVVAVGGFGIVYLARDHALDREVAVKEFMPTRLAGRSHGTQVTVTSPGDAETFAIGLRSFVNEAKLLAGFSHGAMVKVYRFWEANGTAYMVMPYLHGPTLHDVRRSMPVPPTEAWIRSVIAPLLDALELLHAEGVYHRDIAPDNVLLAAQGRAVLLDFGAARRLIADCTQMPTAIVKPHYAPVEQYGESTQLRQGPWTDLYALGALMAYLVDGRPPPPSTARAIHDEREPLAGRVIDGMSPTFLAAIDWALAVRPQARPQSIGEFRQALAGRQTRLLSDASRRQVAAWEVKCAVAGAPQSFEPTVAWKRRSAFRKPLVAAALVASVGAVVAGAAGWRIGGGAPMAGAPAPSERVGVSPATSTSRPPAVGAAVRLAAAYERQESFGRPTEAIAGTVPREPTAKASRRASSKERPVTGRPTTAPRPLPVKGPIEACAGHNFFLRPFCVQRQCESSRFAAQRECIQSREAARARQNSLARF